MGRTTRRVTEPGDPSVPWTRFQIQFWDGTEYVYQSMRRSLSDTDLVVVLKVLAREAERRGVLRSQAIGRE